MARTKLRPNDRPLDERSGEGAPNPVWFKPLMFGFMLLGLAWVIVFYVSQGAWLRSRAGTSSSASVSPSSAS
jgi:hypothetical protein